VSQSQDDLYQQATAEFSDALDRLVRAYELDPDKRRDLLQDIHLALWRSFDKFEARCSLRTWVYRVAHNIAASHVIRQRRMHQRSLSLEEIESLAGEQVYSRRNGHERLDVERLSNSSINCSRPIAKSWCFTWKAWTAERSRTSWTCRRSMCAARFTASRPSSHDSFLPEDHNHDSRHTG
jgi:hypothetical protein